MVEGIYRVSGKREDVLSLQEKFDESKGHTLCEAHLSPALTPARSFPELIPAFLFR